MVTIINYRERKKEDGTTFYVLEVQSGIEMIKSKSTGNYYATAKKAYVPSTFDEAICKGLIGTQMDGTVQKQECEPFEYTVKETGEIIQLSHRYVFLPPEEIEYIPQETFKAENVFSQNGILEPAL